MRIALSTSGMVLTLLFSGLLSASLYERALHAIGAGRTGAVLEIVAFAFVVFPLIYGNLVYQIASMASYQRQRRHRSVSRETIETVYGRAVPHLLVLIPSYKEDQRTIWQTLMSAALVEYPNRRVVLLIDDPPHPENEEDRKSLSMARQLPAALEAVLSQQANRFKTAYSEFAVRKIAAALDLSLEAKHLSDLYNEAASWLEKYAENYRLNEKCDHTDTLFLDDVVLRPARCHRQRAQELARTELSENRVTREYRRLASLFDVRLVAFERKRYENLSHAPNKAMNLNAYLGLVGRSFREVNAGQALRLEECNTAYATISVPASPYVITLDADSLLLSDYALRLVHVMEQPGNEKIAVAQTPYSAVPGTPNMLERIAGATTDIQHIVHQGTTAFDAAYWVGANALLRYSALEDVVVETRERGHKVPIFIQDKTLIEDTGSTIDLIRRGWRIYNYPARLAYSATPPDFGALLIQRRRWANGGLLILPNLFRYLLEVSRPKQIAESLVRLHYLLSPSIVSFCYLALLLYPFDRNLVSIWLPAIVIPYYLLYASDLCACGYAVRDLPRIYALNLLLVIVNLSGVILSLRQAITGRKGSFGRTPKVTDRTPTPPIYLAAELSLAAYLLLLAVVCVSNNDYWQAAFFGLNAVAMFYGLGDLIGFDNALQDLRAGAHMTDRDLASQAPSKNESEVVAR